MHLHTFIAKILHYALCEKWVIICITLINACIVDQQLKTWIDVFSATPKNIWCLPHSFDIFKIFVIFNINKFIPKFTGACWHLKIYPNCCLHHFINKRTFNFEEWMQMTITRLSNDVLTSHHLQTFTMEGAYFRTPHMSLLRSYPTLPIESNYIVSAVLAWNEEINLQCNNHSCTTILQCNFYWLLSSKWRTFYVWQSDGMV